MILAGIVERTGGIRVVVTALCQLDFHIDQGERAYVVDILDRLPTPEEYADVIERATAYVMAQK